MEETRQTDEIEINLSELFLALWEKKWMIIFSGIFLALAVGIFSQFFITKKYESSTKIFVLSRQQSDSLTITDLQMGTQLTKDYKELVLSRTVLEKVISEMGLDLSYDQLKSEIQVAIKTDTRILEISVKDADPYLAKEIATAVRIASAEHIRDVMNIESVNLVDDANLPSGPVSPNVKKNVVIGGVAGAFLAALIILVVFILDDTIKSAADVEKYLGLTVLGSIPKSGAIKSK
ncbi:MAG TPA: protein-tyrosine kinase [Candidatus Merdenecus merdavium]|nr:protein-tyrosine kinase [Candidatus Merdenecus merdavium]